MKRASLKSVKVSVLASPSQDVTDRLLKSEGEVEPATVTPRVSIPVKPRRARKTSPARPSSKPAASPVAIEAAVSDDAVNRALTQTRLALEALTVARDSAEARYDLGIRYRLDSLAHHLEQVTQFVTAQTV